MKRMLALAMTMTSLLALACSGSVPTSPSRAAGAAPSTAIVAAQSTPSALFGAGVVDSSSNLIITWSCLTQGVGCPARLGELAPSSAAATAPGAPENLMASVNGSTVNLGWLGPTTGDRPTSYVIEAGSAPGASDLAVFDTGTPGGGFTATSVGAGTYYVRVRAKNAAGTSGPSNEVTIVVGGAGPGPCTGAPGAPGGLLNSVSGSTVTLTWNAASGSPTTYIVEAGSASGLTDLANSDLGGTATSLTAAGVGAGTYFVRVRARNACGLGPASNEVIVTVGGAAPPPGGPSATYVGLVSNGDGLVFPNDPACGVMKADVQFVLSLAGNAVSGPVTTTFRVAPGGNQCEKPGKVQTSSLSGTLSGSTLTFTLTLNPRGQRLTGTATITSTRVVGSVTGTSDDGQVFVVTFSANRQ